MTLRPDELVWLAEHAIDAAHEAGRYIARTRPTDVRSKGGGLSRSSQVLTEVDQHSQRLIIEALAPTMERFDLGLLAEEDDDSGDRLTRPYFWCIDPLDGTLGFVESTPGYSVSIALVSREGVPLAGVVYDPVERTLYHAVRGHGLFVDRRRWARPEAAESLSLFMDRSARSDDAYAQIITALHEAGLATGSAEPTMHATAGAVMNACRVLTHPPAVYFKLPKASPGGGSLWDFAATACLFHEAGAVATDIHGQPLDLNRADSTFMNHRGVLFATDRRLAASIREQAARAASTTSREGPGGADRA